MADVGGGYHKVPSDSENSQHINNGQRFKVGTTLLCGSFLALFLILGTSSSFPALHSTNAAESTSLFGFPNAMRASTPFMSAPARAAPYQGKFLSQGFRPPFPNAPYQARTENVVPKGFFKGLGEAFQDKSKYSKTVGKWKKGDDADFFSRSGNRWLECSVTDVSDKGVMVNVKPGYWINDREQALLMRKRFGIKGYSVDKGKNLDLPERSSDKQKALIAKQRKLEEKIEKGGVDNNPWNVLR